MRYDPRTDQARTIEELGYPPVSRSEAATNCQRGSLSHLDPDTVRALAHALGLKIDGVDV